MKESRGEVKNTLLSVGVVSLAVLATGAGDFRPGKYTVKVPMGWRSPSSGI